MDFQTTPPQRLPPRFVPTLTEVVHLPMNAKETVSTGGAWAEQTPAFAPVNAPMPAPMPVDLNAQIVHRVMQRVDATLSRSLREAMADLVLTHTRLLEPLLRDEIEGAVRRAVESAIAQELQDRMG